MLREKIAISVLFAAWFTGCSSGSGSGSQAKVEISPEAININTAGVEELRRIPNVGEKLAAGIIAFREKHGPFRRPEYLLLIDGVSDRRFREIRHLVRTE
jgi:competence protein ComEA